MTDHDPILHVAALRVLADYTRERYNAAKEDQAAQMNRGSRLVARSPLGMQRKIAALSLTDPKPVARITDRAAFTAWVKENYPEAVSSAGRIVGSDKEVAAVLFEHAPHLITWDTKVDPAFEVAVRTGSASLGAPVAPNGETDIPGLVVELPEPQVRCVPEKDALAEVVHLFRVGKLSLDSFTHPELPDGVA